jgi:hypothetical protein
LIKGLGNCAFPDARWRSAFNQRVTKLITYLLPTGKSP